jgi:hypothetical protein
MAKTAAQTLDQEIAADAGDEPVPQDKLDRVRAAVRSARDISLEIAALRERLSAKNVELSDLIYRTLPDTFVRNGVRNITLEAEGNLPAYTARLTDYYRANISTDWDQERQDKAYDLLEKTGRGDLVKKTISVRFGLKEHKMFKQVYAVLRKIKGLRMEVKRSVPWNTLTAMIKETYEGGEQMGSEELYALGATVGQIVHIKEEK